jgi:hypothetical protein
MKFVAGGCCDDVWIPYIAFTNLKYLPQVGWGLGVTVQSLSLPALALTNVKCRRVGCRGQGLEAVDALHTLLLKLD